MIVGHSERRADQHESDDQIRAKAEAVLAAGLTAIVCVGESDAQRRSGEHEQVVEAMLAGSLPEQWENGELVVAYEPIWAIGTGNVATAADVAQMHAAIRAAWSAPSRQRRPLRSSTRFPSGRQCGRLFAVPDVDGALVGGASLTAALFVPIIEAAGRG